MLSDYKTFWTFFTWNKPGILTLIYIWVGVWNPMEKEIQTKLGKRGNDRGFCFWKWLPKLQHVYRRTNNDKKRKFLHSEQANAFFSLSLLLYNLLLPNAIPTCVMDVLTKKLRLNSPFYQTKRIFLDCLWSSSFILFFASFVFLLLFLVCKIRVCHKSKRARAVGIEIFDTSQHFSLHTLHRLWHSLVLAFFCFLLFLTFCSILILFCWFSLFSSSRSSLHFPFLSSLCTACFLPFLSLASLCSSYKLNLKIYL